MTRARFYVEAGSDSLFMDGRQISHEDAADLIEVWRDCAFYQDRIRNTRMADLYTRTADELEDALKAAQRWRRCIDGHPDAYVGREAFRASLDALRSTEPERA